MRGTSEGGTPFMVHQNAYKTLRSYLMRVSQPRIHDCMTMIALSRFFSNARSSRAAFVLSKKLIFCDSLELNMALSDQ